MIKVIVMLTNGMLLVKDNVGLEEYGEKYLLLEIFRKNETEKVAIPWASILSVESVRTDEPKKS